MTGDVEARLRASLEAYARLVDDAVPGAPGAPVAAHRRSRTARWAPVLVAAAVLVVVGALSLVAGRWGSGPPPADTAASGSRAAASSAPGSVAGPPGGSVGGSPDGASVAGGTAAQTVVGPDGTAVLPSAPALGVIYVFDLSTHCGIRGAVVGGVWFAARPAQVLDGGNPPPGWGNPEQRGTLTLTSPGTAVFRDDAGHVVQLVAAPLERPGPCD